MLTLVISSSLGLHRPCRGAAMLTGDLIISGVCIIYAVVSHLRAAADLVDFLVSEGVTVTEVYVDTGRHGSLSDDVLVSV